MTDTTSAAPSDEQISEAAWGLLKNEKIYTALSSKVPWGAELRPFAISLVRAALETFAAPQHAAQQGDALTYEQAHAIRQGHEIASSDAYFNARPQIDGLDRRNVFRAGFERGWDAARAQAKEGGA